MEKSHGLVKERIKALAPFGGEKSIKALEDFLDRNRDKKTGRINWVMETECDAAIDTIFKIKERIGVSPKQAVDTIENAMKNASGKKKVPA